MVSIIAFVISVLLAYLIGSFPTSFILTKMVKGIDIRQVGSKNAGATNVLRNAGKVPALVTLIVDILKGTLTVTLVVGYFYSFGIDLDYDFYRSLMGIAAISGHIWPIFLGFRGGKGVATTLGVGLGLAPQVLMPAILIWIAVFSATNYVSLASISALVCFPIIACIFKESFYIIMSSVIICLISVYKHKENIKRLIKGDESKTYLFKKHKSEIRNINMKS
jgi:glycerol-3-phosphate acyltransferase PlsY